MSRNGDVEGRLWASADQFRANSGLKSSEYAVPVLGLIFLRFADVRFSVVEEELASATKGRRRGVSKLDYQARGVLFVPQEARYARLLELPEGADIARAVNEAMHAIEEENPALRGVLPKEYQQLENDVLASLLKTFAELDLDFDGDVFGRVYEYFLGKFAMAEGQRGGEFFTPTSLVRLIVEVIEPYHGLIYDPACGSGGMFVQSADFVKSHQKNPSEEISIYGQEKTAETVRLCRMNLAVHGLEGDIKQANSYYDDVHSATERFDFVMANPPFNVNGVDKEKIKDDPRFPYGLPRADNANYLWIQLFWSTLNEHGRAGFVMANSASDARQSEQALRRHLVDDHGVDVMISIAPNFFYTVTLPCTLWFLDKGKRGSDREDNVLFIDARHLYSQIDRAHREFTPAQLEFIANIVRLYRDEKVETANGSQELLDQHFPEGDYQDVPGLCKKATLDDIRAHGYSLNPGRYVGVAEGEPDDYDFTERLEELHEELVKLETEATRLQEKIDQDVLQILEASQ